MGQTWEILNIDAKQRCPEGSAKLGEFFFDNFECLYRTLCLPILPKEVDDWLNRGKKVMQPGLFGKLSVELIDKIYEELPDETPHVTVALAITCKHLLQIGKRHILRTLRKSHAPWVGARLICLGDNADDNDLPKGMLTDAELKESQETELDWLPQEEMKFSIFATETYDQNWNSWGLRYKQKAACRAYTPASRPKVYNNSLTPLERLEIDMIELLCCLDRRTLPTKEQRVLCNTTKAVYVREDKMSEMVLKWSRSKVDLAHALLSRICWSSSYGVSMVCDEEHLGKLCRGPWAGDRFCITALDSMPSPGVGKKWTDVTAEVDEFLMYLWKVNEED